MFKKAHFGAKNIVYSSEGSIIAGRNARGGIKQSARAQEQFPVRHTGKIWPRNNSKSLKMPLQKTFSTRSPVDLSLVILVVSVLLHV